MKPRIICPICRQSISLKCLSTHIKKYHSNLPEKKQALLFGFFNRDIFGEYTKHIIEYLFDKKLIKLADFLNAIKRRNLQNQINSFYKSLEKRYNWNPDLFEKPSANSIEILFEYVLPFKNSSPKNKSLSNGKGLCKAFCRNNEELAEKMFEIERTHNPGYQHGGELSPFSKDFKGYKGLTDEEKEKIISTRNGSKNNPNYKPENNPVHLEYWLARGYSKIEARLKQAERQDTRSAKFLISKYGAEEAAIRRRIANEKWTKSLLKNKENSQKIQEGRIKGFQNKNKYSTISQKLFAMLEEELSISLDGFVDCLYGDNEYIVAFENNKYNLYRAELDFYVPSLNAIIEFDGTTWHIDFEKDKLRDQAIIETLGNNTRIYRISEIEYRNNKQEVFKTLLDWLKNGKESRLKYLCDYDFYKLIKVIDTPNYLTSKGINCSVVEINEPGKVIRILKFKNFKLKISLKHGKLYLTLYDNYNNILNGLNIYNNFKENSIKILKYLKAYQNEYNKEAFDKLIQSIQ